MTKKMKLTRKPHNKHKHACQLPMFRMMLQYDNINMHNARQSFVYNHSRVEIRLYHPVYFT